MSRPAFVAVSIGLALGACSSSPRAFVPQLAAAPADQTEYESDLAACQARVAQEIHSDHSGTVSSSVGAAAGAITAASVMLPPLGLLPAWALAKANRVRLEDKVRKNTGSCLAEQGYSVAEWQLASKARKKAAAAARAR